MAACGGLRKTIDVGNLKVAVVKGNIFTEKADVIVCSVSRDLNLSKGRASQALVETGGDEIQNQCNRDYSNGLQPTEIAIVNPGNLNCKKVYLVALPKWKGVTEEKSLYDTLMKCLDEANNWHKRTIAIPSLGTGFLKYPPINVASLVFKCVEEFSKQNPSSNLGTVTIVVHGSDDASFKAFVSEARQRMQTGSHVQTLIASTSAPNLNQGTSHIQVNIKTGRLADFQVDVIVDSTANSLKLDNGGLSESLLEMAGFEMQDECDNKYPNGIRTGEIAVTAGYGLKCRKVYHGSLPKWSDKSQNAISV